MEQDDAALSSAYKQIEALARRDPGQARTVAWAVRGLGTRRRVSTKESATSASYDVKTTPQRANYSPFRPFNFARGLMEMSLGRAKQTVR